MLQRSLAAIFLIFPWALPATSQELVNGLSHANAWVFRPLPPHEIRTSFFRFKSGDEANDIVNDIMALYSLPPNFEVYRGPYDNAAARIENGRRVIYYSQDWFARVIGEDRWKAVVMMAHEIGHHLSGHTLTHGSNRMKQELEADIFAGSVVARLGGSLADARRLYMTLPKRGTSTHPSRRERLEAVAVGWTDTLRKLGKRQLGSRQGKERAAREKQANLPPLPLKRKDMLTDGQLTTPSKQNNINEKQGKHHQEPASAALTNGTQTNRSKPTTKTQKPSNTTPKRNKKAARAARLPKARTKRKRICTLRFRANMWDVECPGGCRQALHNKQPDVGCTER